MIAAWHAKLVASASINVKTGANIKPIRIHKLLLHYIQLATPCSGRNTINTRT